MKPLYLGAIAQLKVELDGPALCVSSPVQARALYPLRRLSRIITNHTVQWSMKALMACAQRGIPVTFVNRRGDVLGYLFGHVETHQRLFFKNIYDLLIDMPDQRIYHRWRLDMDRSIRDWLSKQVFGSPLLSAITLRQTFAECNADWLEQPGHLGLVNRLQMLVVGLVTELLVAHGLSSEQIALLDERFNIIEDMSKLLYWDTYILLTDWIENNYLVPDNEKTLVRLFEKYNERLRHRGCGLLDQLYGRLIAG